MISVNLASDFYDLPQDSQPDMLKQKYVSIKNTYPRREHSLVKIIINMFKWELLLGIVMSFVVAFLLLESPLIMKIILEYIEKSEVTAA